MSIKFFLKCVQIKYYKKQSYYKNYWSHHHHHQWWWHGDDSGVGAGGDEGGGGGSDAVAAGGAAGDISDEGGGTADGFQKYCNDGIEWLLVTLFVGTRAYFLHFYPLSDNIPSPPPGGEGGGRS